MSTHKIEPLPTDKYAVDDPWCRPSRPSAATTTPVCCYCDAPLSCASCGREQPADVAQASPWTVLDDYKSLAEAIDHTLTVHGHMDAHTPLHDRLQRTLALSSTYQSAPERNPPHNSGERLPSSDAAVPGADTCAHSYPEKK